MMSPTLHLPPFFLPLFDLSPFPSPEGTTLFDTLNLNSQASWYADQPDGKSLHVLCLQQLEKDTIFIGLERIPPPLSSLLVSYLHHLVCCVVLLGPAFVLLVA